ncbi:MAG: tetratricopeptide repeat protein [Candidatus Omnitrophica bacterium]|nr:tetratricopeptide repeat protein [Candidatus Omnitrophota bacterium]
MRSYKFMIMAFSLFLFNHLAMPAIAEDDGESFSKTVRALQDSFNKTVSDSKSLKDENTKLASELAGVKNELAQAASYKIRIDELERQISEISQNRNAAYQELENIKKVKDEELIKIAKSKEDVLKAKDEELIKIAKSKEEFLKAKDEEIAKMRSKMEEADKDQIANKAKVELYMKRIEKLQNELQEAQKVKVKAEQLQQSKKTVTELTKEIEKNRQEAGRFHYNLGNIHFRNGEYEKAAYEYEHAMKLMPDDADVYYNLAVIYDFHLGDGKRAFDLYERHLNINPKSEMSDFVKERISETSLKAKMLTN